MTIERLNLKPAVLEQNSNIKRAYPIEKASWIWHPDHFDTTRPGIFRFKLPFTTCKEDRFRIHLSADHRYEASIDGELISRGPDRADTDHWSFATYEVHLAPGEHQLSIRAWWIGEDAPMAQMTMGCGGFILAGESLPDSVHDWQNLLSTGLAPWTVSEEKEWSFSGALSRFYHVIGSGMVFTASEGMGESVTPCEVYPPLENNTTGIVRSGWRLYPSALPEQIYQSFSGGKIVALYEGESDFAVYDAKSLTHSGKEAWQNLLEKGSTLVIPPGSHITLLWDLEEYFCAYPELFLRGGRGSEIRIEWAESLYEDIREEVPCIKGNRNNVAGKRFKGFGDKIFAHGGPITFRPFWFRTGRYIQITVITAKEALSLEQLLLHETRYPLKEDSEFKADITQLEDISHMAVRSIQMCAHETLFDCPYYEQLMYVGDSRLQNLTAFTMTGENRLAIRAVELFRWSHHDGGIVHERYPSRLKQRSSTFALIWVSMVRDLALWRPAVEEIKFSLPVIRYQLDNFRQYITETGLLGELPGWAFMDWVPAWDTGYPPGRECSSLVNLLFVMALKAHADLEEVYGDPALAARSQKTAEAVSLCIMDTFWNEDRSLIADDREHQNFSEHGQCLALINGVIPASHKAACFASLLSAPDLHRTTVYFSFYLVETYRLMNRADLFIDKLGFWRTMVNAGLKTTLESPEPTRSDCHAWGAYPYYFFRTFLSGIRPGEFEFRSVIIEPQLADLPGLNVEMPHPQGKIIMDLTREGEGIGGSVFLPPYTNGIFRWAGKETVLFPGENTILLS